MEPIYLIPLAVIWLILVIVALADISRRDNSQVRGDKKWIWVLVIIFVNTLGPIIYLLAGRKDT
ncbi:PLD nuclease N-terminal domain-containing protein [Paenibacillus sp. JCM 10914]|uniref:PLD nuclease N-terminal domain-containing protein n=1 Tax=Paenibacillus sp. JCM 10914 TaxID=1236974 RepID=UPI000AE4CDF8|nr:PLD nuclease N-terminal domain-containing protein [Paenibacillus sp. JCM 10914]